MDRLSLDRKVGNQGLPDMKSVKTAKKLLASSALFVAFGVAQQMHVPKDIYARSYPTRAIKAKLTSSTSPAYAGYRLIAADGTVYTHGANRFFGDASSLPLAKPIVGSAPTPTGLGYWLVASYGGIFTYGDAGFYGSTGAEVLNKPIVGMAATPDGKGYWLVASDGGIFTFGDAGFYGSTGAEVLNKPVVGMQPSPTGNGYWLVASDGGIFTFGDAAFYGSQGGSGISSPVVSIDASPDLIAGVLGAPGFDVSNFQCNLSSSPTSGTFVMIEANGWPFTAFNPCMAKEATWASNNYQLYTFLALPVSYVNNGYSFNSNVLTSQYQQGPDGSATINDEVYNYGYNAAQAAFNAANAQGVSSPIWWLDIEGANTYWSADPQLNTESIQGAADFFTQQGLVAGLYSGHATMYAQITTGTSSGPGATITGPNGGPIPLWFFSSNGTSACTTTTNPDGTLNPFAGGIPWYIQTSFQGNYDTDVSC